VTDAASPVPFGRGDYYQARHDDFVRRHPSLPAPTYYLAYGRKYAERFASQTRAKMTREGRAWVLRTCTNLQRAIEAKRAEDPIAFDRLEQDDEAFTRFAYLSHAKAYLDAGYLELPASDVFWIGRTPDLEDLFSVDAVALLVRLARARTTRPCPSEASTLAMTSNVGAARRGTPTSIRTSALSRRYARSRACRGRRMRTRAWLLIASAVVACGGSGSATTTVPDDQGGGGGSGSGSGAGDACPSSSPAGAWKGMAPSPLAPPSSLGSEWSPFSAWTGKSMIVSAYAGTGSVITSYDPCADTWSTPIADPSAAATIRGMVGSTLVAFEPESTAIHTRLDTTTMTWSPMKTEGGPMVFADIGGEAFFTDNRLLVFGHGTSGVDHGNGHVYDLKADAWKKTAPSPPISPRESDVKRIVGSRLVLWGGMVATNGNVALGDGFAYDMDADAWQVMSSVGAPSPRLDAVSASTGSELIVWGGKTMFGANELLKDGAVYDPKADAWRPMSTSGAPSLRTVYVSVWTGDKLFVLGFADGAALVAALYDPKGDAWTSVPTAGLPPPDAASGGSPEEAFAAPGGKILLPRRRAMFDPATSAWTTLPTAGAPKQPNLATVWTGARLIAWGEATTTMGTCQGNDGGPCDPAPSYTYATNGAIYRTP
jgi:hypothetical protein